MRILRNTLFFLLTLLVLAGGGGYFYMRQKFQPPTNQLTVAQLPATCTFAWRSDSTAQSVTSRAQLLVPVKLPGCARTCYLQFDTGAPYTLVYAHPLAALRARYPATQTVLLPQADTVRDFRFALGRAQVQVRRLPVLRYGAHQVPADSTQPFIIGTLGTDVLDGRVLVVDYARRRFSLSSHVPDSLIEQADFAPMTFDSRRVLLQAGLEGQLEQLLFDSGSSAYALLTSPSHWQELAQRGASVQTKAVNSWGKTLTSYTAPTVHELQVGRTALPLGTVTYIEGASLMQNLLMRFSGMGGMLGNEPFANRTIILDAPGGRFGVVRQQVDR